MPRAFSSVDELPEFLLGPDLRIELVVVNDVVTVLAALARLENWRGIKVGDAELLQIGTSRRASSKWNSLLNCSRYVESGTVSSFSARKRSRHSHNSAAVPLVNAAVVCIELSGAKTWRDASVDFGCLRRSHIGCMLEARDSRPLLPVLRQSPARFTKSRAAAKIEDWSGFGFILSSLRQ